MRQDNRVRRIQAKLSNPIKESLTDRRCWASATVCQKQNWMFNIRSVTDRLIYLTSIPKCGG